MRSLWEEQEALKDCRVERRLGADAALLLDHDPDCPAVAAVESGHWDTPWCGIVSGTLWRAKDGTLRGTSHPWHIIVCNSTQCGARKIVRCHALAKIGDTHD